MPAAEIWGYIVHAVTSLGTEASAVWDALWNALYFVFVHLIKWIFHAESMTTAVRHAYSAFFAVVYLILPEALQDAIASSLASITSLSTQLGLIVGLAWWVLGTFTNTTVLAACMAGYFIAWPICVGVRLGLRLLHHFWGSD